MSEKYMMLERQEPLQIVAVQRGESAVDEHADWKGQTSWQSDIVPLQPEIDENTLSKYTQPAQTQTYVFRLWKHTRRRQRQQSSWRTGRAGASEKEPNCIGVLKGQHVRMQTEETEGAGLT